MRKSFFPALLVLLLPATAFAQEPPPESDPYAALVEALSPPDNLAVAQKNSLEEIRAAMSKEPDIAEIERECAGFVDFLMTETTPIFKEYDRIELELRKAELVRFYREEMSLEDARAAQHFYSSDLGRKLVASLMANQSMESTLDAAFADPESEELIREEEVLSDNRRSAQKALAALSPSDLAQIKAVMAEEKWASEMHRLRPLTFKAMLEIANSDFAPHLDARLDEVMSTVADTHLETCEP